MSGNAEHMSSDAGSASHDALPKGMPEDMLPDVSGGDFGKDDGLTTNMGQGVEGEEEEDDDYMDDDDEGNDDDDVRFGNEFLL